MGWVVVVVVVEEVDDVAVVPLPVLLSFLLSCFNLFFSRFFLRKFSFFICLLLMLVVVS